MPVQLLFLYLQTENKELLKFDKLYNTFQNRYFILHKEELGKYIDYSAQTEPLIPRQTEPLVLREKKEKFSV